MKVSNLNGICNDYPNKDIQTISFPKAREIYSPDECVGNDIAPDATIMHIAFKDGSSATFEARNWYITEV